METEFERTRRTIAGRAITITSWCDGRDRMWVAGAPDYGHLLATGTAVGRATTRAAAIESVVRELEARLPRPARRPD